MVFKRTQRKTVARRKRPFNKRKRMFKKNKFTSSKHRIPLGIANSQFVKLKWTDAGNLITTTTGLPTTSIQLQLNSPYDPNAATGIGQISAQYYQYYAQQYNFYRCYGVKLTQEVWNTSTVPTRLVSVVTNNGISSAYPPGTDFRVIESNKFSKAKILPPAGSGTPKVVFKRYIKLRTVPGVTKTQYEGNPSYQAAVNASPSDGIYSTIFGVPLQSSPDVTSTWITRTWCTFYVKFFDRKTVVNTLTVDSNVSPLDPRVPYLPPTSGGETGAPA